MIGAPINSTRPAVPNVRRHSRRSAPRRKAVDGLGATQISPQISEDTIEDSWMGSGCLGIHAPARRALNSGIDLWGKSEEKNKPGDCHVRCFCNHLAKKGAPLSTLTSLYEQGPRPRLYEIHRIVLVCRSLHGSWLRMCRVRLQEMGGFWSVLCRSVPFQYLMIRLKL